MKAEEQQRKDRSNEERSASMKLSVNVIIEGQVLAKLARIPDEEFSPNLLKYVARHNGYQEEFSNSEVTLMAVEWKPQPKLSSRNYVKRDNAFKRADSVEMIPGEPLYKRDVNSTPPRYVRYGKVPA